MIDESTYRTLDAIAARLYKAGVFPRTVQNADVAFAVILAGYELGFAPMASVRGITLVNGKVSLGADATVAACARHRDVCGYFSCVTSTDKRAEYVTHRVGAPAPVTLSYTIEQAQRAGLTSNATWRTHTEAMLRARCAAALARSVYPDLVAGVYDPDEAAEIRGDHATATDVRPATDVKPEPVALPRDNGPGPSGAPLPTAEAPIVEAPPVALPLSDRDLRAMLAELTSATDLAALRAAWKGMADDEKRGTEEQRAALLDAATKRKAVFAEEARLREERKAAADAEPPNDDGPAKPPRGPRKARTPVAPADATGGGAEGADGPVDAPGARSSSGHPMTTRAERRAHLATLPLAETVRLSWRHRAAMPPPGYREACAERVCALTPGFGVDDALAYLDAAPLRVVASQPKTRAA